MNFLNPLSQDMQNHVEQCDLSLNNPLRLNVLTQTGLMDSPPEQSFDRLAEIAAKILDAPLTIVSLINEKKQFFKAAFGMPAPFDVSREIPIDASVCRYTIKGDPIIVNDSSIDPLLANHPSTVPWGIGAILVMPLSLQDGTVLGAFSVVKRDKHEWTPFEINTLKVLTNSVIEEINHKKVISTLETQRELRERFVSSLTHDLRTPLTAAGLNAQLLLRNGGLSEAATSRVQSVLTSIQRANKMVTNLLDVNLIKADQQISLTFEKVDLNHVIKTALAELKSIFGDRFEFEGSTACIGYWNHDAIQRIIENLCSNAVKYGSKSEAVKITTERNTIGVSFSVQNWGNPIPQSEQPLIFEQFKRSHSALSGPETGWGLGLTLVKGLVKAHKGSIKVKSSDTEGTLFSVSLPFDSRSM